MVTVNLAFSNRPQFVNWKANPTRTGFNQALTFKLQGCTLSFCLTNPSFESRSSVKWCTKLSLLGFIYNKAKKKTHSTLSVAGAYNQEWTSTNLRCQLHQSDLFIDSQRDIASQWKALKCLFVTAIGSVYLHCWYPSRAMVWITVFVCLAWSCLSWKPFSVSLVCQLFFPTSFKLGWKSGKPDVVVTNNYKRKWLKNNSGCKTSKHM